MPKIVWLLVALAACTPGTKTQTPVLMLSEEHGSAASSEDLRALENELEAAGARVHIEVASGPRAMDAFGADAADVGIMHLFEYLFARVDRGASARLQVTRAEGSRSYRGAIIVRKDGAIRSLDDLRGKKIAYASPYSTSGFLFPANLLRQRGVEVEHQFAGTHDKALALLKNRNVEAAAIHAGAHGIDDALLVLAETEEIPNEPVFVRRGSEDGDRVVTALSTVARSERGRELLGRIGDIRGFAPARDADYDGVFKDIDGAGRTVFDLVPDGWTMRLEGKPHFVP